VLAGACAGEKYRGVPVHYHPLLDSALAKAGDNAPELVKALASVPGTMREGMAFLVAYMPERDLRTLRAPELSTNVELAYAARNRFSWAREVPDSIFLNDVLPYAILNETRENWRVDFYRRFAPLVEGCTTLAEAISIVNARVRDELKVDYNTRRRRPDQSPSESIEQGMASCSGLSILLTDAFRSVGIPSRVAGTANWHDQRGNHTWSEVWLDGRWYFTEYYPEELDRAWFLADAGRAIPGDRDYAVWASSFKPTGTSFPLVWDFSIDYVPALDVTRRYVDVYREVFSNKTTDGEHVTLRVLAFKNGQKSARSADRLQLNVDIFHGASQVGGGSTAGPTRDMNDVLEFLVEKNKDYTLKYWLPDGTGKELTIPVKSVPLEVILN
jgi:transglutaminase-like putative cysteine protease